MGRTPAPDARRAMFFLPLLLALAACADSTGPSPTTDPNLAIALAAGSRHTCVVAGDGRAYCWGYNGLGQLGDGTHETRLRPVAVSGAHVFKSITGGWTHTCGLTEDGKAYCWGDNNEGALGDGTRQSSATPVAVAGQHTFEVLSAGHSLTCGVAADGVLYCWGSNYYGNVGDGTTQDRLEPTPVATGQRFVDVVVGNLGACALAEDGRVWCWGLNTWGMVGDGTTVDRHAPVAVQTTQRFDTVVAGGGHACALARDGAPYCWGTNGNGQLGDGTRDEHHIPTTVAAGTPSFVAIGAGDAHTCAVTSAGETWCWGYNSVGQLGDGSDVGIREIPAPVATALSFKSLALGWEHTCGLAKDGVVYCWGQNKYGQLGDGTGTMGWTTPVAVRW